MTNRSLVQIVIENTLKGSGIKDGTDQLKKLKGEAQKSERGLTALNVAFGNIVANGFTALGNAFTNLVAQSVEFRRESINLASAFEETDSLLRNSLGRSYETYNQQVEEAVRLTGRSSSAFKENTASIVAMTKAQGFSNAASAETSVLLGSIATDLGSFFNTGESAFDDLRSALAGSSETMQKYGIDVREGTLQQVAFNNGITESVRRLTAYERTQALVIALQEQASDALGDAARTADSYENKQRRLNDTVSEFKIAIGQEFLKNAAPTQSFLLELAETTLPNLELAAQGAAESISRMFEGQTGDQIVGFFKNLSSGIALTTGGYEAEVRKIATSNIKSAESVEELTDQFQELFDIRAKLRKVDQGDLDIGRDLSKQIIDQAALLSKSAEEFERTIEELYRISGSEFGGRIQFDPYDVVGNKADIADYRQEILLAAAANREFGEATIEAEFQAKNATESMFDPKPVKDYVTELKNPIDVMNEINDNISETLSGDQFEGLFDDDLVNNFFGKIEESSSTAVTAVSNVIASFEQLKESIQSSNVNILGADGASDKSAVDFAIENSQLGGASAQTQNQLLVSSGQFSADEITAKTITAYEQELARVYSEAALAVESAGGNAGVITSTFAQVSEDITNAGADVEEVRSLVDGFREDLVTLTENSYAIKVMAEVDGIDTLREARDIVREVSGSALPVFEDDLTDNSIPATANRRR